MASPSDWTLVRSLLAVLREGSLSAAARTLGLTQPTVGRHVDELERDLGAALFTRSPGGLLPTETALGLIPHAERMEAAFAALVRAASTGGDATDLRGTVRIAASEIMGTFALPPILASLRARHPRIILELALNNRTDDLLRRDADIAVRMVRPRQDGLVGRKIGTIALGLFAHRDYLARFGMPTSVEALAEHHIVGFDRDDHSARAVVGTRLPVSRTLFSLRVDSDVAQLMAVRAGLGLGIVQSVLARSDPALVPVLEHDISFPLDCWLVVHEDQKNAPAIRGVLDGLAEGLQRWLVQQGERNGD